MAAKIIPVWVASLIMVLLFPVISAAKPPSDVKWGKVAALSDEFDSFDQQKWNNYHPGWAGRTPSHFAKDNVFAKDGKLCLRSTSRVASISQVKNVTEDVWVNSAAVSSKEKIALPGYYYETRIKASDLSMTSSFWFRMGRFSEIDVIENVGRPENPDKRDFETLMKMNTHLYREKPPIRTPHDYDMGMRSRDHYIVYGLWWKNPNEIIFYCNDKPVVTVNPEKPFDEPLHMIFDTEVFHWVGFPTIESLNDPSKNTMYVDWVRTWKPVE